MDSKFEWTEDLIKELLYTRMVIPNHIIADVQKCLDEFKEEHSQKEKDIPKINFELFVEEGNNITAVKRLYDGEIFSVNDITNKGKIYRFEIRNGELLVGIENSATMHYLNHIEKVKPIEKDISKDFEVIAYIGWHNLKKDTIFKKSGSELFYPQGVDYHTGYNEWYLQKHATDIKIHAVKRVSDSEVFKIGDYFKYFGRDIANPIREFVILNFGMFVKVDSVLGCMALNNINKREKPKVPLFTTEDGVEIFEGDKFIYLNYFNWTYCERSAPKEIYPNKYPFKYLSTLEKAKEYILLNKPIEVSYKEFMDYRNAMLNKHGSMLFEDLIKEFFKQKINL